MKRMKRGLAVLLAVLLIVPALPAYAEEVSLPEVVEDGDTVSGGDVSSRDGLESESDVKEGLGEEEEQVALLAGEDVVGDTKEGLVTGFVDGTDNAVSWTYDPETKTTVVTGKGKRMTSNNAWSVPSSFPSETGFIRFEDCELAGSFVSLFNGLENLTFIDFTNLTMTNATDMSYMFFGCSSLPSLDLSSFDTASVTDMGSMFYGCSNLTSLDLSSFNTTSVTDMESMFYGCSNLTSLDLSNFDTVSVTTMWNMFSGCSNLTSLDLSNFDTASVITMWNMFYGCSNLTSLDLSSFNTVSVTDMSSMFHGCSSLRSLGLSSFDTASVAGMEYMFYDCSSLRSLDLSNFDTASVTTMWSMFSGCSNLTSLDLSNFDTASVAYMRSMFSYCSSLQNLDLSSFGTASVTDMSSMFRGCSSLRSLDLSSFDTASVTNMEGMFSGCSSLPNLDLSSFDTANVTDMSSMFSGCSSLRSLNLSSFDTANVTKMWDMFSGCSSLPNLDLRSFDTASVTNMGSMFSGCSSLVNLDLRSFDTASVTYVWGMFYDCSSLVSLDLSSFGTASVTDMGSMFYNCSSLVSLDLSSFDTTGMTGTWFMFYGCSSLISLDLSSFDTTGMTGISHMFNGCSSMTEIKSPHAIAEGQQTDLPATFYDADFYESSGEYKTMTVLDVSCAGKTLKRFEDDEEEGTINAESLPTAVQYVMYEYILPNAGGTLDSIRILEGTLPEGMELQADGKICGIPMETGEFIFTVGTAAQTASSNSRSPIVSVSGNKTGSSKTYKLTVSDNSDTNVNVTTDPGYEIVQRVPDFTWDSVSSHTLVSVGTYGEFRDVYIDGVLLEKGKDYTSEEGSTRITIMSETLERFSAPGVHTILVEFRTTENNDLRRAVQNYWVTGSSDNDQDGDFAGSGSDNEDDGDSGDGSAVNQNTISASIPIKYVVVRGDVLGRIARKNGISLAQLLAWNPQIKNPNRIYPGQVIVVGYTGGSAEEAAIQSQEGAVYDVVQKGDSLYRIAIRNGVGFTRVIALNPELMKQKYIYQGQKVRVK